MWITGSHRYRLPPEELLGVLPVENVVDSLAALHDIVPVLKDYIPPKQDLRKNDKKHGSGDRAKKKPTVKKPTKPGPEE